MDDSSDRAQLLYKLIKPSLHPALLAKGQSHCQSDSTKHRRTQKTHNPTATEFTTSAAGRAGRGWRRQMKENDSASDTCEVALNGLSRSTNLHCVLVSKPRFIFVYFILEKKDMQATTMRITNMFAMMCFAESKQGWKPSGCSILAPFLSSIWLLWTITALWGVDTFSCSSICGVVINFLTAIGVTISWDLKQPQSCNQSP